MWTRIQVYLSQLSFPTTLQDLVDVLSKTLFTLAAAAIAAGIGVYNHHRDELAKIEQKRAEDAREARERSASVRDTLALFMTYSPKDASDPQYAMKLKSLASYCDTIQLKPGAVTADRENQLSRWKRLLTWIGLSPEADDHRPEQPPVAPPRQGPPGEPASEAQFSSEVEKTLCLSNNAFGTTLSNAAATQTEAALRKTAETGNAQAYTNSNAGRAQAAVLAAGESAGAIDASGRWYAVIASVPASEFNVVPRLVDSLNLKLKAGGMFADVHVYCTRLSQNIALTSGGGKSQADAEARARLLRIKGLVADSFAQPDRGWVAVKASNAGACPHLAGQERS